MFNAYTDNIANSISSNGYTSGYKFFFLGALKTAAFGDQILLAQKIDFIPVSAADMTKSGSLTHDIIHPVGQHI